MPSRKPRFLAVRNAVTTRLFRVRARVASMIGRLTGVVIERAADGCCVLDVQGVGYEVFVPVRCVARLPAAPGLTTLHVHTHVREDVIRLFGFESALDRSAFRVLLGVSGIATKLALAVLGDLDAAELGLAVARADHK